MTQPQTITPAPVRRSVTVAASRQRAWTVFTSDIGLWWPRTHHIGAAAMRSATIEPRAGGRWFETGEDGSETPWGEVLAWDPPGRLVMVWRIGGDFTYNPALHTEVEVVFTEVAGGTRVDLEHRHLERMGAAEERARAAFESPNGWGGVLALFAAAV
jgi:uncharacterized protein YndB with AHSA1/START domain